MKTIRFGVLAAAVAVFTSVQAQKADSIQYQLDDVVVTGTRQAESVRHLPMTVTVINREKLTEQHQTSILPTVMQQVPGFFVTSRSVMGYGVSSVAAGSMNMRGIAGTAGQMLVLIDGHPQYNGIYGHPIADSYQMLMAERVEVLRGPASVLYGSNAMGGVLNIVTRQPQNNGVKYNLGLSGGSYGTFQGEISRQQRSGRLSSTVSAQYARTDNHRPRMGFEQYGGYAKVGYDINHHWNAYIDADLTHFSASYPGTTFLPMYSADQWITRGVVSAAVENHYGNTSGAVSVFSNFGRHKIDDGTTDITQPTTRYFRSKDALTGFSAYQSIRLLEGNCLTVGMDYQHIYGHAYYTDKKSGEVLVTPKMSGKSVRNEVAGYVDIRQDLLSWLTVDAGLRLDHHSVSGTEWIPQAGIVVRPIETGEVKVMVSKGFRNPTMREMYLYASANEDLLPERIWNYELSWRQRLGAVSYGANVFYLKGDNMIQAVNRKNVNTGEIENFGVEAEASWRINSQWNVSTNHSLLHMWHPILAAPRYKGFLGVDFFADKLTANLGVQYVNGLYTNVEGNEQKDSFCLLNLTVGYEVIKNLQLWARGENLLAERYEYKLGDLMPRATCMAGISWSF